VLGINSELLLYCDFERFSLAVDGNFYKKIYEWLETEKLIVTFTVATKEAHDLADFLGFKIDTSPIKMD
jgi:hypothetical protein